MPNHVKNVLRVTGPLKHVAKFREACRSIGATYPRTNYEPESPEPRQVSELSFHGLLPVPQEVQEAGFDKAGYDWQHEHWGTKWDAYHVTVVDLPDGVAYFFQTAWSMPRPWFIEASKQFSTLEFELWARDEYPWAATMHAYHYDGEYSLEVCYGETERKRKREAVQA